MYGDLLNPEALDFTRLFEKLAGYSKKDAADLLESHKVAKLYGERRSDGASEPMTFEKSRRERYGVRDDVVEARGVEPLSENPFLRFSPSAGCHLAANAAMSLIRVLTAKLAESVAPSS